jgi:hypothetical protein
MRLFHSNSPSIQPGLGIKEDLRVIFCCEMDQIERKVAEESITKTRNKEIKFT